MLIRATGAYLMMEREREHTIGHHPSGPSDESSSAQISDAVAAAAARRRAFALGFGSAVPNSTSYFEPRLPPGHGRPLGLQRQDTKL